MKNNNARNYPGAKWWKFDFHTHTPVSVDARQDTKPEFWLQKFMEEEIDCVAITDHNSGKWIDELKGALKELEELGEDQPDWYRQIYLFPGVEISAHGGVHILAIFDPEKDTSHIDSLLGAVGYHGTKGHSDKETAKSITEVIDEIVKYDGISIPAHVDKKKGMFNSNISGLILNGMLDNNKIIAMEVCADDFQKPQKYTDRKLHWAEVVGSDMHDFEDSDSSKSDFGKFTWIKMDTPSIEGLRLALIDGVASVNRDMNANPNKHSKFIFEELTIEHAKYIGEPDPITCKFNPFLNTIIGGRGSGKSTLLEFMRLILRQEEKISENIREEKYFEVGEDTLLTNKSKLSLVYKRNETRYRLNWLAYNDDMFSDDDMHLLEVQEDNNDWKEEEGEITAELFPASIYSQKQIFELSNNPQALLDIIDEDKEVGYAHLEDEYTKLRKHYNQRSGKIRDIVNEINKKKQLQGKLSDIGRQIKQIEESGHTLVLKKYHWRKKQLSIIEYVTEEWEEYVKLLTQTKESIEQIKFDEEPFNDDRNILSALEKSNEKWIEISEKLNSIEKEAQKIIDDWNKEKTTSKWINSINSDISKYNQLKNWFQEQNINPEEYSKLIKKQATIKNQLSQIEKYSLEIKLLEKEKEETLADLEKNRKSLNENRQNFLSKILSGQEVSMKVDPFAEKPPNVEEKIRQILQLQPEYHFDKDIEALMDIYRQNNDYQKLKDELMAIGGGRKDPRDRRFQEYLRNLPKECIDNFQTWFPKDHLVVTFTDRNQILEQGSPGQKCAALLAFILAYGDTPLLLDQPEDDLDNELIYDLIVTQIRKTKSNRQIIIVTHNANIVVNGDAEMVIPLKVRNGQTHIESNESIQSEKVREEICTILEGGRVAFDLRHRRIHLEK